MELIKEIKSIGFHIEGKSFSVTLKEWNPKMNKEYSYMVWMDGFEDDQSFSTIKPDKNDNIKYWSHPDDAHIPQYVRFRTLSDAEKYYSKLIQDSRNYSDGFKRIIDALVSIS